jgi:hypothetical protein
MSLAFIALSLLVWFVPHDVCERLFNKARQLDLQRNMYGR